MTDARLRPASTIFATPARTCTCRHPRCFSDDNGRCHRCGYNRRATPVGASVRQLSLIIAQIITRS